MTGQLTTIKRQLHNQTEDYSDSLLGLCLHGGPSARFLVTTWSNLPRQNCYNRTVSEFS